MSSGHSAAACPLEIEVGAEATERPAEALAAGEIDVALITITRDLGADVDLVPLFEDEIVAVLPENHAWASELYIEAGRVRRRAPVRFSVGG